MRMCWIWVVVVVVACGSKDKAGGSGGGGGGSISIKTEQYGDRGLKITVTTEPEAEVYAYSDDGDVDADDKKAGMTKGQAIADSSGVAVYSYNGPAKTTLHVTSTKGTEKTQKAFPISLDAVVVIKLTDATPHKEGGAITVCTGTLEPPSKVGASTRACDLFSITDDIAIVIGVQVPGGKQITIGAQTVPIKDGAATVKVEMLPLLAKLPAGELAVKLPVTIEAPDGTWKGELALDGTAAETFLKRVANGKPAALPGEPADDGKRTSAIMLGIGTEFIGAEASLASVDVVAIVDAKTRKLETCKYRSGTETKTIDRYATDLTAVIYDRRSGKQLTSKSFAAKPPPKCAQWVTMDDQSHRSSSADDDEASGWIKSQLK